MVVMKFCRTQDVALYARELGMAVELKNGKIAVKEKKINGATWSFEGFVYSIADGMCNISLFVR